VIALAAAFLLQAVPEETLFDTDFDRALGPTVRAVEELERTWKDDPAAALGRMEALLAELEKSVVPTSPKWVETTLVVRWRSGITKGEVKERHGFFPYRLAGEIALAAGKPARAAELLAKSPSSAALLAEARKAAAAAERPAPPPPLQKPGGAVEPLLLAKDFAAAIDAVRRDRARLGEGYEPLLARVRGEAARHQKSRVDGLAAVLPRLLEADFEAKFVRPCLDACARVPAELESDHLRWARRLRAWLERGDPSGLDALALEAAPLGPDYHALARIAQQRRLAEIEAVVEEAGRAGSAERPALLARLDASERAFGELARARGFPDLEAAIAAAKDRFPISAEALDRARAPARTVEEIRVRARDLELLWASPDRRKLGARDQADLAVLLGVHRASALFLEGRTVAEAAEDPLVRETLRGATGLPSGVSPKVEAVRRRLN